MSSGNICRSPIAEAVFIDEVKKAGVENEWEIDSAAIGSWHVGRNPDSRALATMKKHNLAYSNKARQVSAKIFIQCQLISQIRNRSKHPTLKNTISFSAWTMTTCTS